MDGFGWMDSVVVDCKPEPIQCQVAVKLNIVQSSYLNISERDMAG